MERQVFAKQMVRQQDVQAAHRIRDKLMMQRTAKVNQIRGLASEYGLVAPIGIKKLREAIPIWHEDTENGLSSMFRILLNDLFSDLVALDATKSALMLALSQWATNPSLEMY